jgi:thymidylate synthase (FAD)
MESSRYCCYDKEKFGDELTFILPDWIDENTPKRVVIEWTNGCQDAENHYMRLRDMGWPAEQCAQFLPKAAKTQIVMTGFASDWRHFLDLRYYEKTGKVHPQMKSLSTKVKQLFEKEGIDVYVDGIKKED